MSPDQMDSIQPLTLSSNSILGRTRDVATFRWMPSLIALSVGLIALGLLFRETLRSMVAAWGSENYSHCYLIPPTVCWLVWRDRKRLSCMRPRASVVPVLLIALLSLIWLIGKAGHTNLIRQLSFVAMIPATVWAILGAEITLTL